MQLGDIELILLVNKLTNDSGSEKLKTDLASMLQDDPLSDRTRLRCVLDLCLASEQESVSYRVSLAHLIKSSQRRCRLPPRFKEQCDELLNKELSLDYDPATRCVTIAAPHQSPKT